jgi:purine-binding chemotaxis protein CheW
MSSGRDGAAVGQCKVVVFEVSGEPCAVSADAVREVVPMALLSRPPGAPTFLAGFLNLRGGVIPVLRTCTLLGLPERPVTLSSHLLVLAGAEPAALLVDRVRQVVSLPEGSLRPIDAGHTFNACALGDLEIDGRTVHLLSPERLLLEQERRCMEAFRATELGRVQALELTP